MSKYKPTHLLSVCTAILFSAHMSYAQSNDSRGPIPSITSDNSFIIYYGDSYYTNTNDTRDKWLLNETTLNDLAQYDVVVVQPNQSTFTPEVVQALKDRGVDIILGYISIGEDFINDAVEDPLSGGPGMSVYDEQTNSLITNTSSNLQSFYLDVDTQFVEYDPAGTAIHVETIEPRRVPDGKPDYNPIFRGYMVNPDNNWRWVIDNMRIEQDDVFGRRAKAGLKQLAGVRDSSDLRNRSGNFGFDGFFLDTIDTAGPYDGEGWYPWTIQEMTNTVKYISDTYTDKIVLANRGAFYFSAGLKSIVTNEYSIDYSIRPYVNAFLFESFRYDSSEENLGISPHHNENRLNIAPKVLAEANRPDGFTIFGLEYQSGRQGIEDDAYNTAIKEFGFVSYLADNRALNSINNVFLNKLATSSADITPPTWGNSGHQPNVIKKRIKAFPDDASNGLTVQWDTAIDQSYPISYDIIVTNLNSGATTTYANVDFEMTEEWKHNPLEYPANQFTTPELELGSSYEIQVQAIDAKGNRNTDGEKVVMQNSASNPTYNGSIVLDGQLNEWTFFQNYPNDPDDNVGLDNNGNQANWRNIQVAHTPTDLYFAYTNETNIFISWGFQIFIDIDNDQSTGFNQSFGNMTKLPIGADYLIEGVNVYKYRGPDWLWDAAPAAQGFQVGRAWSGKTGEVQVPLHWIGSPQKSFKFIVVGHNGYYGFPNEYDWYPDGALTNNEFFEYTIK